MNGVFGSTAHFVRLGYPYGDHSTIMAGLYYITGLIVRSPVAHHKDCSNAKHSDNHVY